MKHFTWILALSLIVAAVWVFGTIRPPVRIPSKAPETAIVEVGNVRPTTKPMAYATEVIEPILVLPEIELAPMPEAVIVPGSLVPDLNVPVKMGFDFSERPSVQRIATPRPESGRHPRPWMPYAAEDVELSATRRLEWTKLGVRETPSDGGGFEETAEPPLFEESRLP